MEEKEELEDKIGLNEGETFLTTEIPYLQFQALEWISERVAKKRNDKVWMENFMTAKKENGVRTDINE